MNLVPVIQSEVSQERNVHVIYMEAGKMVLMKLFAGQESRHNIWGDRP